MFAIGYSLLGRVILLPDKFYDMLWKIQRLSYMGILWQGLRITVLVSVIFQYVVAFVGKKQKWANVISIIIGAVFVAMLGTLLIGLLGLLAIIGGTKGLNSLKQNKTQTSKPQTTEKVTAPQNTQQHTEQEDFMAGILAACPIDYDNKPLVSYVLDAKPDESVFLGVKEDESDDTAEFRRVYATAYNGTWYVVLKCMDGDERGGVAVFRIDYENDGITGEENKDIVSAVYKEYKAAVGDTQEEEDEPAPTEYIKPKLPLVARKIMMGIMIASYSLLLIAGILFASIGSLSSLLANIGLCEQVAARAYGIVIGTMFVALAPSIGYYFATIAPINLSKKIRIILALVTTALMLALAAVFYIVIYYAKVDGLTVNKYFEGSDVWFVPLSMGFAAVGIMICYLLTMFRINPSKIRTNKPVCGDGLVEVIKWIFCLMVYAVVGIGKGILKFKEWQPEIFIFVATILLTWLAYFTSFIFAIICIALLIGVVVMYLTGFLSWAYMPEIGRVDSSLYPTADDYYHKDEYTYTDDHGYTQTVYSRDGEDFYDVGGHYVGSAGEDGEFRKD